MKQPQLATRCQGWPYATIEWRLSTASTAPPPTWTRRRHQRRTGTSRSRRVTHPLIVHTTIRTRSDQRRHPNTTSTTHTPQRGVCVRFVVVRSQVRQRSPVPQGQRADRRKPTWVGKRCRSRRQGVVEDGGSGRRDVGVAVEDVPRIVGGLDRLEPGELGAVGVPHAGGVEFRRDIDIAAGAERVRL